MAQFKQKSLLLGKGMECKIPSQVVVGGNSAQPPVVRLHHDWIFLSLRWNAKKRAWLSVKGLENLVLQTGSWRTIEYATNIISLIKMLVPLRSLGWMPPTKYCAHVGNSRALVSLAWFNWKRCCFGFPSHAPECAFSRFSPTFIFLWQWHK